MSLAEGLFKDVYGEVDDENGNAEEVEKTAEKDEFSLLMARKPAVQFPASPPSSHPAASEKQTGINAEATSTTSAPASTPQSSYESQQRDVGNSSEAEGNGINPWTIAKTHFFPRSQSATQRTSPVVAPRRESGGRNRRVSASPPLASPSYSSSSSSPPERTSPLFVSARQVSREAAVPRLDLSVKSARERARERYGNGALDTWFQKTTQVSLNRASRNSDDADQGGQNRDRSRSGELRDALDPSDIRPVSGVNKPFKIPITRKSASSDVYSSQLEDPHPAESNERRQESPVLERWSSRLHQLPSQEMEDALDFERRKRAAILSRREQMRSGKDSRAPSSSQLSSNSPHQNRYLAARAALTAGTNASTAQADDSPAEAEPGPSLDRNDPRAYFMRHQEETEQASGTGLKINRVHTGRLPLEKIPDGFDTHELALRWPAPLDLLSESYRRARLVDSYTQSGTGFDAFAEADLASVSKTWEARLAGLIRRKYRARDGDGAPDLRFDLYAAIRAD